MYCIVQGYGRGFVPALAMEEEGCLHEPLCGSESGVDWLDEEATGLDPAPPAVCERLLRQWGLVPLQQ